ncbi:hypothetical protein [Enterobacter roggenkampii]|uniref:Ead/Ea22-like family protein n=1 Tax=Enterobacter roggenkampii TaxID=1812935 RepID=A0ABY0J1U9_9ENTR|nr:hypothetical protein [Enterobacter roggenkampii]SAA61713.1 Uncharacterised protein [Enterobacter roggenkampii]
MITEKDNVFYCDCGFTFERGRSGAHDCGTGLRKKLAESQREFRAADATIENMQMQVEKLAAENAGLKGAIVEHSQCFTVCKCCGTENDCSHDDVCRAVNEVPETNAFLAEVRAQGVEMFATKTAEDLRTAGGAWGVIQEPYHEVADYLEDRGESFAAQLRKGVQS